MSSYKIKRDKTYSPEGALWWSGPRDWTPQQENILLHHWTSEANEATILHTVDLTVIVEWLSRRQEITVVPIPEPLPPQAEEIWVVDLKGAVNYSTVAGVAFTSKAIASHYALNGGTTTRYIKA